MKASHFTLILGSGLLAGGILGWSLKPQPQPDQTTPTAEVVRHPRPAIDKKTSARSAFVDAELLKIKANQFSDAANFADRDPAELQALVMALLRNSDPIMGLDPFQQSTLHQIILALARKDRDATLAWIDDNFTGKARFNLYQLIMGEFMKDVPPGEQLAFLKSKGFDQKAVSEQAGLLMANNLNKTMDIETALLLLDNLSPDKDGPRRGVTSYFEPGFDFARFAEATATNAKANGNKPPECYPMNFFEEWAKAAPQSAVDFYFKNCTGKDALKLPFCEIDRLLTGVKAGINHDDYVVWYGQTFCHIYQN